MKAAISTDGDYVSMHFGRCPCFTIIDIQNGKIVNREIINNPGHQPGFLPKFLHDNGIECIIAGGMGMKAQELFNQHNIEQIVGISGKVEDVIDQLVNGTLASGESFCKPGSGKGYGLDKTECEHPEEKVMEEKKNMKICITSRSNSLDAQIDPRFGRCQYFIIVDPESMKIE